MLYIATDHAGWELKQSLIHKLTEQKVMFLDLTPELNPGDDYPNVAKLLANNIKNNPANLGIGLCGSGQGITMALNRYPWIRAIISKEPEIVKITKIHNKSNVMCLAGRFWSLEEVWPVIKIFLKTEFDSHARHQRRIDMIS